MIRDAFPALGGAHQAALPDEARRLYYPLDYQEAIRTWARANACRCRWSTASSARRAPSTAPPQSWAGARGLMQLMPATARELAAKLGLAYSHEQLADPAYNVRLGTTYFRQVLDDVRRQRRAGARRLQRRPLPHQAAVARVGRSASSTASSKGSTSRSRRPTSSGSWCSPTATGSSIREASG